MSRYCANCGKEIPEGAKFCIECGTPAPAETPAAPQAPQPAPQAPAVQQPAPQPVPPRQAAPAQPFVPQINQPAPQAQQPVRPAPPVQQGPAAYNRPGQVQGFQGQPYMPGQPMVNQKKKSKGPLIAVIIILVVLLAAGGIAAALFLTRAAKPPKEEEISSSVSESVEKPESKPAPTPTAAPAPEPESGALPITVERVPAGMTVLRVGGLSLPVPEDYEVEYDDYDKQIDVNHPDYPYTIDRVLIAFENVDGVEDPEEGMEEALKEGLDTIFSEERIETEDYTLYKLSGEASAMGLTIRSACYVVLTKDEVYAVAFASDGTDNRLGDSERLIAYDPSIKLSEDTIVIPEAEPVFHGAPDAQGEPKLEDFDWALKSSNHKPEEYAECYGDIAGKWKCCIYYDDMEAYELCKVEFYGDDDLIEMEMRLCSIQYNGEAPYDESDVEPFEFYGSFYGDELYMSGSGAIESTAIYTYDGKQYFVGYLMVESGEEYQFYMVRP